MLAAPILFLAILAANGSAAADQANSEPVLRANADGSWTITRAIDEEPAPLAVATRGLVIDEEEWAEAQDAERGAAEAKDEAAVQRLFEEAVDSARREEPPQ